MRMRSWPAAVVLVLLAALVLPVTPTAAQPAGCGASPPGNGTGYVPPRNPGSLPGGVPRPGPEILHAPLRSAPQLQNTGPWQAEPIMVSGTRAYRDGEFLYQDFLYDDRALPYPDAPERYAGNAADIVEVRLRLLEDALAVRVTFNAMLEVDAVATTIALGDSAEPHDLPHGAGAVAPAEVVVTAAGCAGTIVAAADGTPVTPAPVVTTDLGRRQVEVRVPYAAFDPRGRTDLRVAAAAGLWDATTQTYLRPDPERPAFFNVAFRPYGAWTQNTWMDVEQGEALAAGDLSPLFATVDTTRMAAGVDDDLVDQPGGVPSSGPTNRILVSRFEPVQGRGSDAAGGGILGEFRCDPPECTPQLSGRLQPYSVYVPDGPPPADGYGLVVNLHGANSNHNHFEGGGPQPPEMWRALAEDGARPAVMLLPNARGASYFYHGLAAADVFEAWAHVAATHDLDPSSVVVTGSSMGGFGTYKLGVQFPDLVTAIFPNVGINTAAASIPPAGSLAGEGGDAWRMFASLRNVPVLATSGLNDPVVNYGNTRYSQAVLDQLGYRHDYWWFAGGFEAGGHAEYRHLVPEEYARLAAAPTDTDPRRVTYVLNAEMSEPAYGLTADHAYWLSGMALRDESATFGTIDVTSRGFPTGDPDPGTATPSAGPSNAGSLPYERITRSWADAPPAEAADVLEITAENVAAVTIDVDRARVSCDAAVEVDSDGPLEVTLVGRGCGRPAVVRAAGAGRVETAVAVGGLGVASADAVVLARADEHADALAGGPLAAHLGAPLLLTDRTGLSAAVAAEIDRLGARQAILLGGEAGLGPQVEADLADRGVAVRRLARTTRYATAAAIAAELPAAGRALLARGDAFPDALAASGLGAATGTPVLLTGPDALPEETRAALAGADVTVVGGTAAISEALAAEVAGIAAATSRVAGGTRYATSAAVADLAVAAGVDASRAWVATGEAFPDALVAGAAAGRDQAVLLLVDGRDPDGASEVHGWLAARAELAEIRIAGGTAAISPAVEAALTRG